MGLPLAPTFSHPYTPPHHGHKGPCPVLRFPHIYKPGNQGLRGLGTGQSTASWGRGDGPHRLAPRALKDCLPNKLCKLINELHQTTLRLGRKRTSLGNGAVRVSRAALGGPGCPSPAVGPLQSLLCRNPTSGSVSTRGSVCGLWRPPLWGEI